MQIKYNKIFKIFHNNYTLFILFCMPHIEGSENLVVVHFSIFKKQTAEKGVPQKGKGIKEQTEEPI
jgi:hypothetical protein